MNVIDDKGRLFGTVNVIDALVVLLVLAVAAAGTAFVLQSGDEPATEPNTANVTTENATRYATLDLGTHPTYVAERVTENDTATDTNLTVTDVYRVPTDEGLRVWARVELDGQLVERDTSTAFTFADRPLRPGSPLQITTDEYTVNGTVHDLAPRNASLPTTRTPVVLQTTTSAETAAAIQQGDTDAVAGDVVATVESVDVYPTNRSTRERVVLGATLHTLAADGHRQFLGRPVRIGATLPIETDAYAVDATVVHRGALALPGERTTATVTVRAENVAPGVADDLAAGLTERGRDGVRARVTDARAENATVVVESDDGNVYEREHPRKQDVTLTVELDVRRTDDGPYFHGERLRTGDRLVLDLGSITVRGTVVDIQRGE